MDTISRYFKKAFILVSNKTGLYKILRFISDKYENLYNIVEKNKKIPALSGWSIIIVTTGNNKSLDLLIDSIYKELKNTPYEIIVVGPPNLEISLYPKEISILHAPYKELNLWGVGGGISRKKNYAAQFAKYDKLEISHDYLLFMTGWKKGFDDFGDFTVATTIMLNDTGERHKDWMVWDYPGIGQALLPYSFEFTKYQYINGAYIIVKRDFFLNNPLDETKRWGEGEDVEWSMRIREKTKFRLNTASKITYSKHKPGNSQRWMENTEKLKKILEQNDK